MAGSRPRKTIYDFASIEAMEASVAQEYRRSKECRRRVSHSASRRNRSAKNRTRMSPLPFENRAQVARAVIDDEGRLVLKALVAKPNQNPGKPMPPPPNSPRQEVVRRFSILDVRGCLVKNHRLDEVELRRFADLLRAERVVIVTFVDSPREETRESLAHRAGRHDRITAAATARAVRVPAAARLDCGAGVSPASAAGTAAPQKRETPLLI